MKKTCKPRKLDGSSKASWIFLIHQIPPAPDSFRVKVWRAIGKSGAIAVKNSVYALPDTASCAESFSNIAAEIRGGNGEAVLVRGTILEGLDIEQAVLAYNSAINGAYRKFSDELKRIERTFSAKKNQTPQKLMEVAHLLGRIESQINSLGKRNHYSAEGDTILRSLLAGIKHGLSSGTTEKVTGVLTAKTFNKSDFKKRIWVTRAGLKVDRLASAWLIEREIDKGARFQFVDIDRYRHEPSHLRFDIFGGEFTHAGDLCTFEMLLKKFKISDPKLKTLSQIIHDLDIEDNQYQHPSTEGVRQLLQGIILMEKDDFSRKEKASLLFEQLLRAL